MYLPPLLPAVQSGTQRPRVPTATLRFVGLCLVLATYLSIVYGYVVTLPFLNDDYFFLERAETLSFPGVWSRANVLFGWFRPWSAGLHYWALVRLFGTHSAPFHIISCLLWLAVLLSYRGLVEDLTDGATSGIAMAGVAALALWAAPILWSAGVQDLWMLFFGLLYLRCVMAGRVLQGAVAISLALLSKELAAVLPFMAVAYYRIIDRDTWMRAFRRPWLEWLLTLFWAASHPTLQDRLFGSLKHSLETEHRPPAAGILLRTALAPLNLDALPWPQDGWTTIIFLGLVSGLLLGVAAWLPRRSNPLLDAETKRRTILLGASWAAIGSAPLVFPSIQWHPYYTALASLGWWLAIAVLLRRRLRLALAVICALAMLREARASTLSWDFGAEWYHTRAGALLNAIRGKLIEFHPRLPSHSRLYFARIPNQIGLLAADGPAIRIWYGDSTLEGRYYSEYEARTDTLGRDLFFRFDTARVLVEVVAGRESIWHAMQMNPLWGHDHEVLASMFIRGHNVCGAAGEYGKLATAFPNRPELSLYAGAAHEACGMPAAARLFYDSAARTYGAATVERRAADLVGAIPRR